MTRKESDMAFEMLTEALADEYGFNPTGVFTQMYLMDKYGRGKDTCYLFLYSYTYSAVSLWPYQDKVVLHAGGDFWTDEEMAECRLGDKELLRQEEVAQRRCDAVYESEFYRRHADEIRRSIPGEDGHVPGGPNPAQFVEQLLKKHGDDHDPALEALEATMDALGASRNTIGEYILEAHYDDHRESSTLRVAYAVLTWPESGDGIAYVRRLLESRGDVEWPELTALAQRCIRDLPTALQEYVYVDDVVQVWASKAEQSLEENG